MEKREEQKGAAVNAVMAEIAFQIHLKRLAEARERQKGVKKKQRKEACTAATEQASSIKNMQFKTHINDNTMEEICQAGGVSGD